MKGNKKDILNRLNKFEFSVWVNASVILLGKFLILSLLGSR